ncbi:cell filamentation protein Fic [Labilibaculum manganireducens]|uniref:Cell filamentation protein Fic n=1 Tax=Labilibaculum manganireducens TaxID=1940525 RepID=A0A2N3I7Z2_9BACT|nr:Fic family protein [Labilibaculum manganireducens]PKQ66410.1 cell filamentation protein Fic [Labilibaculum manganireducens]
MDLSNFVSGKHIKQIEYKSFSPEKINHEWIISTPEVNKLLAEANRLIGELNAFSQIIPDVDFFISMHILKEATTSSRIEGTKTNMEEALIKEEDINPEKRDDWSEVQNYIKAINTSIKELEKLPISNRLIKNTHKIILSGVRGKHKIPGEFRTSQNWIGATLKDAIFIPPHHSEIIELMSDFEKFLNDEENHIPHLIKIAIAHYQFETIHPFLDGNGRLGRLIITLYLVSSNVLKKPSLYLSDFFEKNKGYYYDNLMTVRTNSNLIQWIKFFLVGVIETSNGSIQVFKDIITLKNKIETEKLPKLGSKIEKGQQLIKQLFQIPIIDSKQVSELLQISPSTANRLIKDLIDLEILSELTGYKRNRKFIFAEYFNIFQNK